MRGRSLVALLLLLGGVFGLRLWGLDFMLPHRMEPDGEIVAQVRLLDAPERDEDWQFGTYGLVIAFAARALPFHETVAATPDMTLDEHLANSSAEVLRVRFVVALLSLLLIPATYRLARKAVGRPAALFAAALAGTSLLAHSMGQQARPHSVATGLYVFAVLGALCLRRRPTWKAYVVAGVAAGLAIGVLQSGVAVLIPLAVAHLARDREGEHGSFWRVLVPLGIVAALFWLFYPFVFGQSISSVNVAGGEVQQSGHEIDLSKFNGRGFGTVLWTFWSYDPVLLVLGLGGLAVGTRRALALRARDQRLDLLVVLAFAVPYLLAIGSFEGTQERFILPLVPYAAVLAGIAGEGLLRRAGDEPMRRQVTGAVLVGLLAFPTYVVARLSSLRAAEDTLEAAASWIEANLDPAQATIVQMFPVQLPLFHDEETSEELRALIPDREDLYPIPTRWLRYQMYRSGIENASGPDAPVRWRLKLGTLAEFDPRGAELPAAERLRELGATHVVSEQFPVERELPGNARAAEELGAAGRTLARFTAWGEGAPSDTAFGHEGLPEHLGVHVVAHVLAAERFGPAVEVLEVR